MHTNDSPGINRDDIDGRTVGTLVVGAGQAGLVMGRRLQLAGEDVLLVEADARVGDTWRRHYDSLKLFSLPKYSSLPGHRIPCTTFPTRDEMADYLEDYARRFDLPVHTSTRVLTIERQGVSFAVRTNRGTLTAGRVVVASGAHRRPIVPAVAAHLAPGITQLHSLEYRGPHQFAPGGVLVVGAANSGTDVALEAARSGHPTWLAGRHPGQIPVDIDTRRAQLVVPVIMFMFRHVLTLRTPMGRKAHQQSIGHGVNLVRNKLADIEDAGIVCVGRIEAEQDGRPVTADGSVLDVSTVVWCTGSEPDHSFLPRDAFDAQGRPLHERGVSTIPGLYFLGLEFQYALASGTIQGLERDARHLMKHMRGATRGRGRRQPVSAAAG
jgi:putative flavoprotein involved in K+ transport